MLATPWTAKILNHNQYKVLKFKKYQINKTH